MTSTVSVCEIPSLSVTVTSNVSVPLPSGNNCTGEVKLADEASVSNVTVLPEVCAQEYVEILPSVSALLEALNVTGVCSLTV